MFNFLFFVVLVLLPFGRIANLSLFQSERKAGPLSPLEVILPLLIATYVVRRLSQKRLPFVTTRHGVCIVAFVLWAVLSLLVSVDYYKLSQSELLFSALYLARWCVYAALFFIVIDYASTRARVETVLKWLAGGCLIFCLFGLFQSAFLPDFALSLYPDARPYIDYDPQGHRLVSTLLDPNIAAGYIAMFGLLSLSFYVHGFKRWGALFLICVVALVLTLSRGGAVGFLAGLLITVTSQKLRYSRLIVPCLVIALVVVGFFPLLSDQIQILQRFSLTDRSAVGRMDDWQVAFQVIGSNPVFGIGYNTFGFVSPLFGVVREGAAAFTLAGDLLLVAATTGLPGFLIYSLILIRIYRDLYRLRPRNNQRWSRAFAIGVTAATTGAIVESCFTDLLLFPQTMAVLWILWGLSTRLVLITNQEQRGYQIRPVYRQTIDESLPSSVGASV